MARRASVQLAAFVWDGFVLHVGERIVTPMHALASVEILLGLSAPITIQGEDGETLEADCVVVGSNVRHAFSSARFAMLWIEPESDAGRRLVATYCARRPIAVARARIEAPRAGPASLAARAGAILERPASCDLAWRFATDVLDAVAGELPRGRVVHPAIRQAVRILEASPRSRIPARELAAKVGLSTSRLTHLFRETMGVPLRRFAMWQRLRRAVVVLAAGGTATEAAHEAGFTDTAHLHRVLKMMLGARPSDLQAVRSAANLTLRVCARPARGLARPRR